MVRALTSHQCVLGSIPGPGVICGLSLLLVLYSAPRGFSPGTPVFPSHQKPTLLNSNSIRKQWMKSHLVEMPLQIPIIIIIIIIITLSIRSGVRLIEVFNNRNQPNTIYFSVRVRLMEVSAEQGFVIKGNIRR